MQKIISANRLRDGLVVYLGRYGEWVTDIAAAAVFASEEAYESGRASARHAVAANFVLDVLDVDITDRAGERRATTLRNMIRALGPTIDFKASASSAEAARS